VAGMPPWGVLVSADAGASLLVTLNGRRLLPAPRHSAHTHSG